MTFQPGHTFSPGRRHGSRNKRTAEIFNRLENRGDLDPADLLSSIVTNNQEANELRIQAAGLLMPYKYGKHGSIPPLRYNDEPIQLPEPATPLTHACVERFLGLNFATEKLQSKDKVTLGQPALLVSTRE
jgi:hypothetical protein